MYGIAAYPIMGLCSTTARPPLASTRHPERALLIRLRSLTRALLSPLRLPRGFSRIALRLVAAALIPLGFEPLSQAIVHTKNSSPGPGGLPYQAWSAVVEAGCRVLCLTFQDVIRGISPPTEFNHSLVGCIPKELESTLLGIPSAQDSRMRPTTLSNASQRRVATEVNATLESGACSHSSLAAWVYAQARHNDGRVRHLVADARLTIPRRLRPRHRVV